MQKVNMINILSCGIVSYLLFYVISFLIFSVVSVDTVIGAGLLFLFYLFYFFGNKEISKFLLSQNKMIYFFFVKLIYLVLSLKNFILILNESYLNFLWYKFNGLKVSLLTIDFMELKLNLLNLFNINRFYNNLFIKLLVIDSFIKKIDMIETINNNDYVNINIFINLDFLLFIKNG